jgi:hypothetical protein
MSFRVSQPKYIISIATPSPSIGSSINIPGYYQQNGVPINNQFYPALSTATTEKAISRWTNGTDTSQTSWNAITWSPELGLFGMVRQGGGLSDRIASSPDGITWQLYKSSLKSYQGIVWCRDLSGIGMFVATASNNPTGQEITISTNGTTWTDISNPSGFSAFGAVAYSPELRRVVATSSSTGYVYSDDGYNWIGVLPPAGQSIDNFYNITWSSQLRLFVSVSPGVTNRPINVSPDGINWSYYNSSPVTSITSSNTAIAWSPELGIFCFVESPGIDVQTGKILISSDGINWTPYTSSSVGVPYRNLSWSPQLRVFLGTNGNSIYYSYNGINWIRRNISFNTGKSSCWSPELGYFIIGGSNFNTPRSYFAGRPPTSFNIFDSSLNNINELGLWNFQSFGRGIPVLKTGNFTVSPGENWIDVSNTASTVVTLPSASLWPGREIMIKTIQNQAVNSFSTNIFPLAGGALSSNILTNTAGKFATLVSDGTNWQIRQAN